MRLLPILAALACLAATASAEYVVCYFSSWAVYRPGLGAFDVDDVDPFVCTHGIFGFAGLSNHTWTIEVLDPWNEKCPEDDPPGNNCAYDRFVALKEVNPELKTILAVGGWNEGSEDYSVMVSDPAKRATFVQSCIALLLEENFDGLDVDWEYPTQRGGVPEDKENFILLLDELRAELDKHGMIMTAALASGRPTVDAAYNGVVEGLVRNLDIMSIMTYDYHGAWENFTHHNSPLCGYPGDSGDLEFFNVVDSIDYWIQIGAPPEKMVMGIPIYGRCFTLDNPNEHGMLADASRPGVAGPYTRIPGTLGWNEICERLKDTSDCTSVMDEFLYEPYMYCVSDDIWCGYDDQESVALKAKFAKNVGLGGTMVWTIDTDDFIPTCGTRKFDIINSIKSAFREPADPNYRDTLCDKLVTTPAPTTTTTSTTTTTPTTTTTSTTTTTTSTTTTTPTTTTTSTTTTTPTTTTTSTTTTTPTTTTTTPTTTTTTPTTTTQVVITTTGIPTYPEKPDCDADPTQQFYPHQDCNKYWWCVDGEPILMLCAPGTYFDPVSNMCRYPEDTDTSHCRVWVCEADGDLFAGAECNEYYECEHGQPVQKFCADGLYFNPDTLQCDYPVNVNTNTCNIPGFVERFSRRHDNHHDHDDDDDDDDH